MTIMAGSLAADLQRENEKLKKRNARWKRVAKEWRALAILGAAKIHEIGEASDRRKREVVRTQQTVNAGFMMGGGGQPPGVLQ